MNLSYRQKPSWRIKVANHIIAVPNVSVQKETMEYIYFRLRDLHHTDTSITVVRHHLSRINVLQRVNAVQVLAASYFVVIVPISISLEQLHGFGADATLNLKPILTYLESIKANVIAFNQSHKLRSRDKKESEKALTEAVSKLFGDWKLD